MEWELPSNCEIPGGCPSGSGPSCDLPSSYDVRCGLLLVELSYCDGPGGICDDAPTWRDGGRLGFNGTGLRVTIANGGTDSCQAYSFPLVSSFVMKLYSHVGWCVGSGSAVGPGRCGMSECLPIQVQEVLLQLKLAYGVYYPGIVSCSGNS